MRLRARARRRREAPGPRPAEPFLLAGARQSQNLGHEYVGTEHVLLAIAEEPGTGAARALARLGLTGDVVRGDIERIIGPGFDPHPPAIDADALATLGIDLDEVRRRVEEAFGPGALDAARPGPPGRGGRACRCIAPRLKRALERAVAEARDEQLRPEHVLVSLAAVQDSVAARILDAHGVSLAVLRDALGLPEQHAPRRR
jgi:ATP-dependent Clp protease ATP-binding subunit ClpA